MKKILYQVIAGLFMMAAPVATVNAQQDPAVLSVLTDKLNDDFAGVNATGVLSVQFRNAGSSDIPVGKINLQITLNQFVNYVPPPLAINKFGVVSATTTATTVFLLNSAVIGAGEEIILQINVKAVQSTTSSTPITAQVSRVFNSGISDLDGSNNSASVFVTVQNTILPISLFSFTGKQQNDLAVLNWSTASEINAASFDVERSLDGSRFAGIGTVKAKGGIGTTAEYTFSDDISRLTGNVFYRLKLVDKDGSYKYSPVVQLRLFNKKPGAIQVTPTLVPRGQNILVRFNGDATAASLRLTNMAGVHMGTFTTNAQGTLHISTSKLAAGLYYITALDKQGQLLEVEKVVVQ